MSVSYGTIMFLMYRKCYVISKHRHVLSSNLMKLLIDPLVFSHLNYSLSVWGPSLQQNQLQQLKRMQNQAVRLCRNLKKYDHITEHYRILRWLPLECLIQYQCLCVMSRQYYGHCCIALCPPLKFGQSHWYGTRAMSTFAHTERHIPKNVFVTSPHIGGTLYLHMSHLRDLFHIMYLTICVV